MSKISSGGFLVKRMNWMPELFNLEGEHAMKRHYYIGDNLEELASAERGL